MEDILTAIENHPKTCFLIAFWITATLGMVARLLSPYSEETED